jgi:hypothetical protein
MATKLGMKRTEPPKPLRRYTPLRTKKGLNKMSALAKAEMKIWQDIKVQRMALLQKKFDYIPCEYCLKPTIKESDLFHPEAHHNDGNRRHNFPQNCRILHRVCNQLIEDRNIRDVLSLLEGSK